MSDRNTKGAVVVTGVSTGIGRACAQNLVASGRRVFGSVRKQADADSLRQELGDAFTPLIFDVTDEAAVSAAAQQVEAELGGETLAGLVNNAGVAVSGPLMHIGLDEIRQQMEINVYAMVSVTQKFLPLLGARKEHSGTPGRIVNISSISGKRAIPFMGPYSISKFGVEALSETLRRELMIYGIDVVVVAPGPIKTAIWDKAEEMDIEAYAGTDYHDPLQKMQKMMLTRGRDQGLPAEKVAALINEGLFSASPKPRYDIVPSYLQDILMPSLLPVRMLDRLIAKTFGLVKK